MVENNGNDVYKTDRVSLSANERVHLFYFCDAAVGS